PCMMGSPLSRALNALSRLAHKRFPSEVSWEPTCGYLSSADASHDSCVVRPCHLMTRIGDACEEYVMRVWRIVARGLLTEPVFSGGSRTFARFRAAQSRKPAACEGLGADGRDEACRRL